MTSRGRKAGFVLGLALFAPTLVLPAPEGMSDAAWHVMGVGLLMAVWWATEALPLAATSLVPLASFPLLGVTDIRETAAPYARDIIFLFLGGFIIALAMQRWQLHRRIALNILSLVGDHSHAIIFGFMLATALLSMWISNTATTMMMMPIAASVVGIMVNEDETRRSVAEQRFAIALMLSVAYAASIGGIGTLIGTPANLTMAAILREQFGVDISFARWMLLGLPMVIVLLPLTWFVLTRLVYRFSLSGGAAAAQAINEAKTEMGRISGPEQRVALVAILVALLWLTRQPVSQALPGLSDAGIAIAGAILLFILPSGRGGSLMRWEDTAKLPWGLVLLFGGGLSLAHAIDVSGLDDWLGLLLSDTQNWPYMLLIVLLVALIIFLTELTSNAATIAAFIPVVGALALAAGLPPILLAAPAAIAASCAFMLPVATPPNAIVFGSGYLTVPQMVRAGIWLNLLGILVISALAVVLVPLLFA